MLKKRAAQARGVREPLQVYLSAEERAQLDDLAEATGLSRAEVLRRGIRSFAAEQQGAQSPMLEWIRKHGDTPVPSDLGLRHDDYLAEAYEDTHEA